MKTNLNFIEDISSVDKSAYERLLNTNDSPFIKHSFLEALETSGCVSDIKGWKVNHLLSQKDKTLDGFLPIYLKNNSHGEFVFDHSWSYALERAGRKYYPKLLTAIPFTPCETRKVITNDQQLPFIEKVLSFMQEKNIESWHILFPDDDLGAFLKKNKFVERSGYKFVWKNKQYHDFDDYLNIFKSRQRKNIKNERKKISKLGITFEVKDKNNLKEDDWDDFYIFYKNTYDQRFQPPYLNKDFFYHVHQNKKELSPVIFFAIHEKKRIAASLCFKNNNALYGRHWGSTYNIDSLHFECCYYQGIEYCINNRLEIFDPGVQGEHKIRRGFEPKLTKSFHYLKELDFRNAIKDFCLRESIEIKNYIEACKRYTPFKKEYKI